ncbi:MAG: 2-C-methyl-D-erythritol 2,4-cyclodiphosphate synthase [Oligoflexia bacterium]|nr:2-C-methyl-D-erythritol 2,4-cyclodiphosphate synthase [Oligoflexia bacterium]
MAHVTGIGYDSHRFTEGRKLIIGGLEIPHGMGLDGHSDADVLCHAIIDSVLGACGKPDIGHFFPDTDPKWKGASSIALLKQVHELIKKEADIIYIDAVIIAEEPRILKHSEKIKKNIAEALRVSADRINVKAKTNEKMGFTGRKEGIAVIAVSTVNRNFDDK